MLQPCQRAGLVRIEAQAETFTRLATSAGLLKEAEAARSDRLQDCMLDAGKKTILENPNSQKEVPM